jgi:type I site-specific restriction endonuclease
MDWWCGWTVPRYRWGASLASRKFGVVRSTGFSPGFFDLIVIDECHRGSADADSAWHEILKHFSAATQIGLTATTKERRANCDQAK